MAAAQFIPSGDGPPKYGRVRRAGLNRSGRRRLQVLGTIVVGLLSGSAFVILSYQTSPRPATCTTCAVGDINAGYGPSAEVYDNASGRLFVLDNGPGGFTDWGVTVINGTSDTVAGFLRTSNRPGYSLAYDPRNGDLYTPSFCYDGIYVLNATTGANVTWVSTPATGFCEGPSALAYDAATGLIVALEPSPPSLLVINGTTNELVGDYRLIGGLAALATNPLTGQVYVTTTEQLHVSFNLTTLNGLTGAVQSSIRLNGTPDVIAYDGKTDRIYVGATVIGSGPASLYNGTLVAVSGGGSPGPSSVGVGEFPDGIAVDGADGQVYVANFYSSSISVVNEPSNRVTDSIPVDPNPASVVYDDRNRCIYALFSQPYNPSGGSGGSGYLTVIAPPGGDCPAPPVTGIPTWTTPAVFLGLATVLALVLAARSRSRRGGDG